MNDELTVQDVPVPWGLNPRVSHPGGHERMHRAGLGHLAGVGTCHGAHGCTQLMWDRLSICNQRWGVNGRVARMKAFR